MATGIEVGGSRPMRATNVPVKPSEMQNNLDRLSDLVSRAGSIRDRVEALASRIHGPRPQQEQDNSKLAEVPASGHLPRLSRELGCMDRALTDIFAELESIESAV